MKKKNIIITIIVIAITVGCGFLFYAFNAEDKESTLTLSEKTWIENNKNNIIDLGVINNIAILNYSGKGLFFDFLEAMEEDTGLDFNKISPVPLNIVLSLLAIIGLESNINFLIPLYS